LQWGYQSPRPSEIYGEVSERSTGESTSEQSAKGLKRQTETGECLALPNEPPGNGHKITDWDKFCENPLTNGDKTQVEIALLWDG